MTAAPGDTRVELVPGYDISRLIVGGWQLSAGHRADAVAIDEVVERLVAMADMGLDTLDCADIYTGVEELYGRFLRRWRTTSSGSRPIRVHTKLVPDLGALEAADGAYVRRIVERSLLRLDVERLDLVQFYWWDVRRGDWLEAVGTLGELQREGMVRLIGATNFTAHDVAQMEGAGVRVVADQVQYSALDRRPGTGGLAGVCGSTGMHLLCYGGLAGGFLTSTWQGRQDPGYDGLPNRSLVKYRLIIDEFGGWHAYQSLLDTLAAVGREHDVDAATVALRFVLDQPGVAATIVGFSTVARMRDNQRALTLALTPEDRARIRTHTDAAPGPGGDVFGLERNRDGPHGRIMKYDLNAATHSNR